MIYYQTMECPWGTLGIAASQDGITALGTLENFNKTTERWEMVAETSPVLEEAKKQLTQYLGGELKTFNLPLSPQGTPFQLAAWQALLEIPFGHTTSYGEQAQKLGRPKAARAVGRANGLNPIAILIPCHRVIGVDGKLTGYAGGLQMKRELIELEQMIKPSS